jgi:glycosyltransferase involved in cell wall biosynthesis
VRVIWVRHSPLVSGRTGRDHHLLPRVARMHDVHVVCWGDRESTGGRVWRQLVPRHLRHGVLDTWVLPKLPAPPGWRPWWRSVNEPFFGAALGGLTTYLGADAVVVGPCWTAMGIPGPVAALRVFDWLDGADWRYPQWRAPELRYLDWCDCAMTVSGFLARRVEPWRKPCAVVPNGVDVEAALRRATTRAAVRRRMGLDGTAVVSLIGLTASSDDYWLRAISHLVRHDGVVFVAAGRGPASRKVAALQAELGEGCVRWLGAVSYEDAMDVFAASDVTWYPADDTDYFHAAWPHKVSEGLGVGTPVVVAPPLKSLVDLRCAWLHRAEPTMESLVATTRAALSAGRPTHDQVRTALASLDWDGLGLVVSNFLRSSWEEWRVARRTHGSSVVQT